MAIDLKTPRSFAELGKRELRYVASLSLAGMEEETIWARCFIKFSGIRPVGSTSDDQYYFKLPGTKGLFSITMESLNEFVKTMSFVTQNFIGIKPYRIGGLYPMQPKWENVTFLQYLDAENFYQAYIHTKDECYLKKLMATIYLKKGEKYDNEQTEKRSKRFHWCSAVDKMCAMMWVKGVKEFFSKKWADLFAPATGEATVPDMYAIVQNQMRVLTDGDITKREMVLNSLAWDALDELNAQMIEARKIKTDLT